MPVSFDVSLFSRAAVDRGRRTGRSFPCHPRAAVARREVPPCALRGLRTTGGPVAPGRGDGLGRRDDGDEGRERSADAGQVRADGQGLRLLTAGRRAAAAVGVSVCPTADVRQGRQGTVTGAFVRFLSGRDPRGTGTGGGRGRIHTPREARKGKRDETRRGEHEDRLFLFLPNLSVPAAPRGGDGLPTVTNLHLAFVGTRREYPRPPTSPVRDN